MPRKGHTEGQIVAVLQKVESGAKVADVCRKVGRGCSGQRLGH